MSGHTAWAGLIPDIRDLVVGGWGDTGGRGEERLTSNKSGSLRGRHFERTQDTVIRYQYISDWNLLVDQRSPTVHTAYAHRTRHLYLAVFSAPRGCTAQEKPRRVCKRGNRSVD